LDIGKWEMNRTHWAVKDVNLAKELKACGVFLPAWARDLSKAVDITTHNFDVALSFPGEVRSTSFCKTFTVIERSLWWYSFRVTTSQRNGAASSFEPSEKSLKIGTMIN